MNSNFTRMATAALVCAGVAGGVAYAQGSGGAGDSNSAASAPMKAQPAMTGGANNGSTYNTNRTDIKAGNVTPPDDATLNRTGNNSPMPAANSGSMSSNNGSNGYNGTTTTPATTSSTTTSSDMGTNSTLAPRTDRN